MTHAYGSYIYKVTRTDQGGYDQYDSFIGCADSEQEVKLMHPNGIMVLNDDNNEFNLKIERSGWVQLEEIDTLKVRSLGKSENVFKGVILSSHIDGKWLNINM